MVWLFLVPALLVNGFGLWLRYWNAWPMLPMYLSPVALPFFLGLLASFITQDDSNTASVRRIVLAMTLILSAAAVFFPKDFYLPFIKSITLWSHLFFVFGVTGKGCFLVSAAWAVVGLKKINRSVKGNGPIALDHSLRWTVWGFCFWTLSMFSGELWSYLGWGTPVVWDDLAITTTMATWFFYICLLHLHLTGSWTVRARGAYAASGALVVLALNCLPDFGPFRWPF